MKILIVEDDVEVSQILNKRLTARGFHVLVAHAGEEALSIAVIQRPDLILIDIILPDIDGPEVVKQLRNNRDINPPIPVIFLSGIVGEVQKPAKTASVVVNGQVFPAISKPFVFEEVLSLIKQSLHLW